jgi:hypothetical protein
MMITKEIFFFELASYLGERGRDRLRRELFMIDAYEGGEERRT